MVSWLSEIPVELVNVITYIPRQIVYVLITCDILFFLLTL